MEERGGISRKEGVEDGSNWEENERKNNNKNCCGYNKCSHACGYCNEKKQKRQIKVETDDLQ